MSRIKEGRSSPNLSGVFKKKVLVQSLENLLDAIFGFVYNISSVFSSVNKQICVVFATIA